jgi:hypothetical protein
MSLTIGNDNERLPPTMIQTSQPRTRVLGVRFVAARLLRKARVPRRSKMKNKVTLIAFCAALGASVVSTQAHAVSNEASSIPSQATGSFELVPTMNEVLAPTGESPAAPIEAMAGKFKDKVKHGWNSVKKGTSNLMGKRVKHMGKHSTRAGMQSKKGRENIVKFLHGGGPRPTRRHSI